MKNYQAMAAGAVVLDVHTGEVLGMASAPDFDPNNPAEGADEGWLNRMSNGTFEMGSTFKSFTMAMALDSGKVKITDSFDATQPIRIGGFTIHDFHGKHRVLTVPEIFQYSSNIGTAKMADVVGIDGHKEFLTRFGLLTQLQTELPEVKTPTQPRDWKKINSITISFGHGVSTTPLQTAVAGGALINGGKLIDADLPAAHGGSRPTRSPAGRHKKTTSDDMRYLLRPQRRTRAPADARAVPGFNVGGKTGTADKVVNGRYSSDAELQCLSCRLPDRRSEICRADLHRRAEDRRRQAARPPAQRRADGRRHHPPRRQPILGVKPKFGEDGSALLVSY